MNKYLPFILTILTFIFVWAGLLQFPYLESISPNKTILYGTFSLYVSIIMFVILSSIYRFENMSMTKEELKSEFTYKYSEFFQ